MFLKKHLLMLYIIFLKIFLYYIFAKRNYCF